MSRDPPKVQLSPRIEAIIGTRAHNYARDSLDEGGFSINDADYDAEYARTWYVAYFHLRKAFVEKVKENREETV